MKIFSAFAVSLLLLLILLPLLKRLKAGQYILGYVKEHKDKGGTPTMGGLAIISAIIIAGLGFCGVGDGITNLTLAITAGFTIVGFLDDFLKIYRKDNGGNSCRILLRKRYHAPEYTVLRRKKF